MRSRRHLSGLAAALVLLNALAAHRAEAQGFFYVRDSFIAITNALLETHNPDVGIAGSWYRLLGQGLRIVNNALRPVANNTDELYGNNTSAGLAEYGVGVTVLFTARQTDPNCLTGFACTDHYGLLWGRGDVTSLNGYFARVTASGQVVILMNYRATSTLLASAVIKPPAYNIGHAMVFAIRNSVKEIYWDGVMILSTTDNTLTGASSALLKNGLGARSTVSGGTVLDDFFISPFPSLTSVSPVSGSPGGGDIITVQGANVNGCYARVAGTVAQGISGSVTNEVFYLPPHDAGVVTVDCATAYTFGVKIPLYAPSLPNSFTYTPTLRAVRAPEFPLAGDSANAAGPVYRTELQALNPSDPPQIGQVVLHPGGAPFTSSDPGADFMLFPLIPVFMPDLNAVLLSDGLGPAQLTVVQGGLPVAAMRVVQGDIATEVGTDVEDVYASTGIGEGGTGVLLAPSDAGAAGFAITVRTFGEDTALTFSVSSASGQVLGTGAQTFPANTYTQLTASGIAGITLRGGEAIQVTAVSGSAMVYSIATDKVSLDFDLQRAALLTGDPPAPMILPMAVSDGGPQGYVRTSGTFYNAGSSPVSIRLSTGESLQLPGDTDCPSKRCIPDRPRVAHAARFGLEPGQTRFVPDVLEMLSTSGIAGVNIAIAGSSQPVMLFRTFTDGAQGGTVGAITNAVPPTSALAEGDTAWLLTPPIAGASMSIGVNALSDVTLLLTLFDATGLPQETLSTSYASGTLSALPPGWIFSVPVAANNSIAITVVSGSALVYSVTVEPGGDLSYRLAQAQ
jgi:hypothetical protein